jgi:UDP-N-acetylmuramate--alanine ligase
MKINVENAVAATAAAMLAGVTAGEAREAMQTFSGTRRRFDIRLKTDNIILIDDYAHHPKELAESIDSIKALYPTKKITGVFQPHLYTRTRDFADEFARSLSLLDEVILLDIYPAREEPIEGVTSEIIFNKITTKNKVLCNKSDLSVILKSKNIEVLVTLGAGDIDQLLPDIEKLLKEK